jgi:hypothetical protein
MLKLSKFEKCEHIICIYASIVINFRFLLLRGLMGGPAHLARGLLGRHGPHKPYPGRAWAYKVARGPARHGQPTSPG